MVKGFWKNLAKPILALAPMADVTDSAFRQIICTYGRPDVVFTEFVSADALCSIGRKRVSIDLEFDERERPIVAQIFGAKPEHFLKAAQIIAEMGFDGIDINMGCPEKNIQKQGSCAALIKNPALAKEIVLACKEGAGKLPVSIKSRIGYNQKDVEKWIWHLIAVEPAVITMHGRTKKDMSKVPADWEALGRAAELVHASGKDIIFLGNGDVKDLDDAYEKIARFKVDGVMIGRAVFGNPWLFNKKTQKKNLALREVLQVMLEHTRRFEKLYSGRKNFLLMRKHFASYIHGFEGAKALRMRLMQVENADEVAAVIRDWMR